MLYLKRFAPIWIGMLLVGAVVLAAYISDRPTASQVQQLFPGDMNLPTLPPAGNAPPPENAALVSSPETATNYHLDFMLQQDSFQFANYRRDTPVGGITAAEVYRIFGEAACVRIESGICTLTPAATQWKALTNRLSAANHATGMTVLSGMNLDGAFSSASYQANSLFEIPRTAGLMREITANWALQLTDEINVDAARGTPAQMLQTLLEMQQPVDIGLYQGSLNGYSLLAYGVEEAGPDIYHVLVYDSNAPGELRFIEVDTRANRWAYSPSGLNPAEDPQAWRGDASTPTMALFPIEAYSRQVLCLFCRPDQAADLHNSALLREFLPGGAPAGSTLVSLTDAGSASTFVARASSGEQVGILNQQIVNDLPGARIYRLRGADSVVMYIPAGVGFSVEASGLSAFPVSRRNLVIISPTVQFSALDAAGSQLAAVYSPEERSVSYNSNAPEMPTLYFSVTGCRDSSLLFRLGNLLLPAGNGISLSADPLTGSLALQSPGAGEYGRFSLAALESTPQEDFFFFNSAIPFKTGETLFFDSRQWSGEDWMEIGVDQDGDGAPDSLLAAANQSLETFLLQFEQPGDLLDFAVMLGGYLGPQQVEDLLEGMGQLGFNGYDLGMVLLEIYNELGLNTARVLEMLRAWQLPLEDIQLLASLVASSSANPELDLAALLADDDGDGVLNSLDACPKAYGMLENGCQYAPPRPVVVVFPTPTSTPGVEEPEPEPPAPAPTPGWQGCSAVTEIPLAQCGALEALYNSTDGANWNNIANWLVSNTPCNWYGVTCSAGSVQTINLSNNNLNGEIAAEIGDFPDLITLNLSNNYLVGGIPAGIGNLANLDTLLLGGNALSGEAPVDVLNLLAASSIGVRYNALYTTNPAIDAFLTGFDANWEDFQTISPSGVGGVSPSNTTVDLNWTPIPYTADTGYYQIEYATAPGGPYTYAGITPDKNNVVFSVTGLAPNTTYYFVVYTYTAAHVNNPNNLLSAAPDNEVMIATIP